MNRLEPAYVLCDLKIVPCVKFKPPAYSTRTVAIDRDVRRSKDSASSPQSSPLPLHQGAFALLQAPPSCPCERPLCPHRRTLLPFFPPPPHSTLFLAFLLLFTYPPPLHSVHFFRLFTSFTSSSLLPPFPCCSSRKNCWAGLEGTTSASSSHTSHPL